MTVATMAAGLLPLLWGDGAGAEITRRVAAPMLCGLATSAFLTLEVLPVLYTIWRTHQLRRSIRDGVPLATVIGLAPAWALSGRDPRAGDSDCAYGFGGVQAVSAISPSANPK